MRNLLALLVGVILVGVSSQGTETVSAQEGRLLPSAVSEDNWTSFTDSLKQDDEYKRYQNFKRAEMEPVIEGWQQQLGAVFVADWRDFTNSEIEVESAAQGDDVRWNIEKKTYNMRYGSFSLYVLKQFGGGKFSQTWTIPKAKLDAIDFEYLAAIRQGTPFDARVKELKGKRRAADVIIELCSAAGAEYIVPGTTVEVSLNLRDHSVGTCIRKVAASAGWEVTISDGGGAVQQAVWMSEVEEWLEARNELADAGTDGWRAALKQLLELKLVEIDTEDLLVHARLPKDAD